MGADIYLKANNGWNCLNIAAVSRHLNVFKTLVDKHNFDVILKDNGRWAALHHSVQSGSYELISFFADIGTDFYINTNDGSNLLHISARYRHLYLCKRLIAKHKFDVLMANNNGWRALHSSAQNDSY